MSVLQVIECDRSHAPAILAIFNDAIANSTALYEYHPRTEATMAAWFDAKATGRYPVIGVTDAGNELFGFASYGPFRAWPAYKYTVEHSVYVARDHRGRGVGRMLLAALIDRARAQDYHNLIAGIDAQNAVSIAMHQRFGFELAEDKGVYLLLARPPKTLRYR